MIDSSFRKRYFRVKKQMKIWAAVFRTIDRALMLWKVFKQRRIKSGEIHIFFNIKKLYCLRTNLKGFL